MNSEQIIHEAGVAIAEFARCHDTTCSLYVVDGKVLCGSLDHVAINHPRCLTLSRWQQKNGLTSPRWNAIGKTLLNLYHKEFACQSHQKP